MWGCTLCCRPDGGARVTARKSLCFPGAMTLHCVRPGLYQLMAPGPKTRRAYSIIGVSSRTQPVQKVPTTTRIPTQDPKHRLPLVEHKKRQCNTKLGTAGSPQTTLIRGGVSRIRQGVDTHCTYRASDSAMVNSAFPSTLISANFI